MCPFWEDSGFQCLRKWLRGMAWLCFGILKKGLCGCVEKRSWTLIGFFEEVAKRRGIGI